MKESKRTVLKTIELFFKRHKEDKPKDPEIKDPSKVSILKVIDKPENISDRTTDTTFPVPLEPIMNEAENSKFRTTEVDYKISDLTKREDINDEDVQPPIDKEININNILANLDDKLNENNEECILNILSTRSSKDIFRETALVEFNVKDKSYIMNIIVEKDEDNFKYQLKSSYGKEIYSKTTTANKLDETIYYPFKAIVLRDKFSHALTESAIDEKIINRATDILLDWMKEQEFSSLDKDEVVDDLVDMLEKEFNITITRAQEKQIEELFWKELKKDMGN